MMKPTPSKWYQLFIVAIGLLVSVVSAAGGYVVSQVNGDIKEIEGRFETHRQSQFEEELLTHERLARIEAILERIAEGLEKE